jgi:uncharacterized membrane protein
MTTTSSTSYPHWPVPARIVRARWKLFLSVVISFVAFIFLPHDWGLVTRVLISWDIGVALYILVALWTIHYSDATHIPRQSLLQDDLRHIITPLTVIAALVILPFIFIELRTPPGGAERDTWDIVLGVLTILLSWAFIHTILAFHYAHEYYSEHRNDLPGIGRPGEVQVDAEDGDTTQLGLFHLQRHSARACRQYCRQRDLTQPGRGRRHIGFWLLSLPKES